jgi:hypothetical protein
MSRPVAHRGPQFSIEYAVLADGTSPGLEYYDGLPRQFKNRFNVLFKKLGDTGRIFNKEQFKTIEGTEFFEFKAHVHRLPCRFTQFKQVIITHGLQKKKPKLDAQDRARRIYKEDADRSEKEINTSKEGRWYEPH